MTALFLLLFSITMVNGAVAEEPGGNGVRGQAANATITIKGFTQQGDSANAFAAVLYDADGVVRDSIVAVGNQARFLEVPTGILGPASPTVPAGYALSQNYPNPFNPSTTIRVQIGQSGTVSLQIFDVLGRLVSSYTGNLQAGIYEFEWEAGVASGVYFYRVIAGNFIQTKKMVKLDGGGYGGTSLKLVNSSVGSFNLPQTAGLYNPQLQRALDNIEATGYAIRIYSLLQTSPQIIDTVIQVPSLGGDTTLTVYFQGAPRDIVIPMPDSMQMTNGSFVLGPGAAIYVEPGSTDLVNIGQYFSGLLRPATGYDIRVSATTGTPSTGNIYLSTNTADSTLGNEGYILTITPDSVTLIAYQPAGIFHGIQTIRQLLPPGIESQSLLPIPWMMQTGRIVDRPRFAWRGAMLDVARHFFGVQDVEKYIDLLSYYKINQLHLHLSDDEGWRIQIDSWPNLALIGGKGFYPYYSSGYYTQAQYSQIVAYAQSRYMTIIPEIDVPGHFGAARAAYLKLNSTSQYWTDTLFYDIVDSVIKELSAITPGPYIHIGGDEATYYGVSDPAYITVIDSVQSIVHEYGKKMIGWAQNIGEAKLSTSTLAQNWDWREPSFVDSAVAHGDKIIMSPANRVYLDQKYNSSTPIGYNWAGYVDVETAYDWDPATQIFGVGGSNIIGVEAPLWSEWLHTLADIEYMAFPRIIGVAEIGWSPSTGRDWNEYKVRLGYDGMRLDAMGVNFYRSPSVPWR
ncbi:MAG: family 20 glycosylhydrolase [Bacteroidetes bacterium]|nr:family 20 glycosylhydrolase [Bacteroidota bacterium]